MSASIYVTGIGAVSALGHSVAAIGAALGQGPAARGSGRESALGEQARLWSVDGLDDSAALGARLKRKLDPFCVRGMVAAQQALQSAELDPRSVAPEEVGIYVGNCLGGWAYTEPELQALHTRGVSAMGPYVATAWFPAALQGQLSMSLGFTGQSKTFSARDVAGVQALGHAAAAIGQGRIQAALCGASEDLSSRFVLAVLQHYATSQRAVSPFGAPLAEVFAEGSAFLMLESAAFAKRRGARPLAVINGFGDRFCASAGQAAATLGAAVGAARGAARGEALQVLDGGFAGEEALNALALRGAPLGGPAVNPRPALGMQFAVGGVLEAALVVQALARGSLGRHTLQGGAPDGSGRYHNAVIQRLSSQGQVSAIGFGAP
jgi:3-oxoacyl-[acyl-carrier-protein] synthase II